MVRYWEKVPIPEDGRLYSDGIVKKVTPPGPGERWPSKSIIGRVPLKDPNYNPDDWVEDGVQLMNPNDNYVQGYKDEYQAYCEKTGKKGRYFPFPPETISVGVYLLILGVAYKLGVYQLLCDVFGVVLANGIMDLATYFILFADNAVNKMEKRMNTSLMFCVEPRDDSWYSKLFQEYVIAYKENAKFGEHSVREFMTRWVSLLNSSDLSDVLLSMDGTNFDCQSIFNTEAQPGHSKSKKKLDIVGVMAAVIASGDRKGMPLAYMIDPGSQPDVTTSKELLAFFTNLGLDIKSLLADRGFSFDEVMTLCDEISLPFVMMLNSNCKAFKEMYDKYAKTIFWNEEYWIEGAENIYGIAENDVQVFGKDKKLKCTTALFFNGTRSSISRANDKKELNIELRRIRREVDKFNKSGIIQDILIKINSSTEGEEPDGANTQELTESKMVLDAVDEQNIDISSAYRKIIRIEYDQTSKKVYVNVNRDALETKYDKNGYNIACSSIERTAPEIWEIYKSRDSSEKSFSSMKTELGFRTSRTSGDCAFHGKMFVCFIADILRTEIVNIFQQYEEREKISIDTNVMILSFNDITYTRSGSTYVYSGQTTVPQREILEELGIAYKSLKSLGPLVNARITHTDIGTLRSDKRTIPVVDEPRKPGRPAGSKNKGNNSGGNKKEGSENIGKEDNQGSQPNSDPNSLSSDTQNGNSQGDNKRGPGRPRGSKNKKTIEREKAAQAERERRIAQGLPPEEPKKRGRQKGSKNKKTLAREAAAREERERRIAAGLPPEEPKPANKGGRPLGRKNNKTLQREAEEQSRNESGEQLPGNDPPQKTSRVGTQYRSTRMQEEYDQKLSEQTGIDIIGNPPPRPWSKAVRQAENRRRAKLRKAAEEKLRELRSDPNEEIDQ